MAGHRVDASNKGGGGEREKTNVASIGFEGREVRCPRGRAGRFPRMSVEAWFEVVMADRCRSVEGSNIRSNEADDAGLFSSQ